jgi:hypothetical protein
VESFRFDRVYVSSPRGSGPRDRLGPATLDRRRKQGGSEMKSVLFAAALIVGGAAMAQQTVQPSNQAPERDARGIPVISDPATAPPGANEPFNPPPGAEVVVNPNQAQVFATQQASQEYPPCTREVTDNCVQTYERGRRPN